MLKASQTLGRSNLWRLTSAFAAKAQQSVPLLRSQCRHKHNICIDGNRMAAYVGYAMTDVGMGYPITPASEGFEQYEKWANEEGKLNSFGKKSGCFVMQSEAGVAGALHGALQTGSLATTFTSSQGLLLMLPNLYRMANERLPGVLHVSSREVARAQIGIYNDHSDVMACRQTGWAQLSSANVQEVHDLGVAAHLTAMKTSLPVMHFYEGMRVSHCYAKTEVLEYGEIANLIPMDKVREHQKRALHFENPVARGMVSADEEFFPWQEASNKFFWEIPDVMAESLKEVGDVTGRQYKLFDYYGSEDAEHVVVLMGSATETAELVVKHMQAEGKKVGIVKVRLFRPFSTEHLIKAIPKSAKKITVLDRTREFGAPAEPLAYDVSWALKTQGDTRPLYNGVYGLHGKDPTPSMLISVFENMQSENPMSGFTVGIVDDVGHTSLPLKPNVNVAPESQKTCIFWGRGGDGTVGVNQEAISTIGLNTDNETRGCFFFEPKKTGGWTQSHVFFGPEPVRTAHHITHSDFVGLHAPSFIDAYPVCETLKEGGSFLMNTRGKTVEEFESILPDHVKRLLAERKVNFYAIDAASVAEECGLKGRVNIPMQVAFLKVSEIVDIETSFDLLKKSIKKKYGKQGDRVVNANIAMMDAALEAVQKIDIPESWMECDPVKPIMQMQRFPNAPETVKNIFFPGMNMGHKELPVSAFVDVRDGSVPTGTTKYEKRNIATSVPVWDSDHCTQCNDCAMVCPHGVIRPFLLSAEEKEGSEFAKNRAIPSRALRGSYFHIAMSPYDCTSCQLCANVCEDGALKMEDVHEVDMPAMDLEFSEMIEYPNKYEQLNEKGFAAQGSRTGLQYRPPLIEFSPACAGCGQTKAYGTLTKLLGDRMIIANATGCSIVWSAYFPSISLTTNKDGHGPAYGNSLFEDNAEYGFGMAKSLQIRRDNLATDVETVLADTNAPKDLTPMLNEWLSVRAEGEPSKEASTKIKQWFDRSSDDSSLLAPLRNNLDLLTKPSHWLVGGDGWAYDIGYGGLDHVLSQDGDVNILVFDNESYANTGFQKSKATPHGALTKFAATGYGGHKKNLGMMAMMYGHIYIASVSMGASPKHMLQVMKEADSYPGPSMILMYTPCVGHGIDMSNTHDLERTAVRCGYWPLYRYDPRRLAEGQNPLIIEDTYGCEPETLEGFLDAQVRFRSLKRSHPELCAAQRVTLQADLDGMKARLVQLQQGFDVQIAEFQS